MRPKASILDPSYTCSVSAYQTAAGTADIMSHIFECYFSNVQGYMQDRMAEGLLKTCIEFGVRAVQNPEDYEARANLMWTSSWAINNFIKLGKTVEWTVHPMEHQLSAYYDITHGVGLAILTPHWMEYSGSCIPFGSWGYLVLKLPSAACMGSSPRPPDSCIITALISSTYSGMPYCLAYFCINGV